MLIFSQPRYVLVHLFSSYCSNRIMCHVSQTISHSRCATSLRLCASLLVWYITLLRDFSPWNTTEILGFRGDLGACASNKVIHRFQTCACTFALYAHTYTDDIYLVITLIHKRTRGPNKTQSLELNVYCSRHVGTGWCWVGKLHMEMFFFSFREK